MRILISAPDLAPEKNVSGISSVVSAIIQGLDKYVRFFHIKLGRSDKDFWGIKGYLRLLKNLAFFPFIIHRNKIDLFHQNIPMNRKGVIREYIFSTTAKFFRLRILVHLHGGVFLDEAPKSRLLKKLIKSMLRRGKYVIVLNDYEKKQVEKLYQTQSIVLKNAINSEEFPMRKLPVSSELPVLLFLGRILGQKGLNEIVDSFEMIYPQNRFKFVLCGAGPEERYFVSKFRELLGDDFVFMGAISGSQKIEVIQQSDYFLLPSYVEGLPIALLENMSCGVIPIVSEAKAFTHVITDGVNGFVVKLGSSSDLAEKLKYVFSLTLKQKIKLSNQIRKYTEENYSIESYNNEILKLYEKCFT